MQRAKGIVLLVLCVCIIALAAQGTTKEEQDVTVVLFLAPLGVHLILASGKTAKEKAAPSLDNSLAAHITQLRDKPIIAWASPVGKGEFYYGK